MKIVSEVTPESMDGDTPLEKEINAFLTSRFILGADVPSDECLHEARIVIRMVTEYKQAKKKDCETSKKLVNHVILAGNKREALDHFKLIIDELKPDPSAYVIRKSQGLLMIEEEDAIFQHIYVTSPDSLRGLDISKVTVVGTFNELDDAEELSNAAFYEFHKSMYRKGVT
jgi:hypothetical protein